MIISNRKAIGTSKQFLIQLLAQRQKYNFSKRYIDKKNDAFVSDLWIMSSDGSEKRFFVKGSNPRWSPDGTKIAFIKKDKNKTSQIFVKH